MAFHLQTDRLAETANDTIHIFLCAYAIANLNNWDTYLSLAKFTYNTTHYKVARIVPFEVDLGYVPCLLIDFLIDPTQAYHKGVLEAGEFV
jgi:hypothetical protein